MLEILKFVDNKYAEYLIHLVLAEGVLVRSLFMDGMKYKIQSNLVKIIYIYIYIYIYI